MAKKKIKRKLISDSNLYSLGGDVENSTPSSSEPSSSTIDTGNTGKGVAIGNKVGAVASAVTDIAKADLSNAQIADTSGIQNEIDKARSYVVQANDNDALMSEWGAFTPMKSIDWRDIRGGSTGQRIGNTIGATASGASSGFTVGGPVGAVVGGIIGLGSAIGGWFGGNRKAKNKASSLNKQINIANSRNLLALSNRADTIDTQNDLTKLANYSAYGGPITMRYTGVMSPFGNTFGDGGIFIKPENRGKFTALKERTGKSSTWYKEHGTPAQKKMATFALNAAKWKHADGGELHTHGGDFTNGLTYIDNGGSHEANPFEGVQMGIDPQGVPNLVEEGEVIFNDYVFSNRLKVPKAIRQKYKLRDNITFADAAKKLSKESEDRPNDPISKRGLESFMSALAESQEEVRIKNEDRRMNRYAKGGKLGKRYDGDGPDDNYMDFGTLASPISYEQLERMIDLGIDGSAIPLTGTSVEIDDAITRAAKKGVTTGDKSNLSYLRFAPAFMSGISAFTDLFSKPDYSAANRIASVDIQPALVSADPISQYLSYKPLDRMFYINQLNKNTAAGRRAIQNTSGGNRAAAMASILAADYNYGESLGKLARQAEEYNQAQKEKVAGFNRQTDMFNSQQSMQAQSVNAQSRNDATKMRLAQAEEVAKLRSAAKNAYDTRRSNNLNNFINNLGNIGWEDYQREWINSNPALYYNLSGIGRVGYKGNGKKNGGKLKKKRRTTYA